MGLVVDNPNNDAAPAREAEFLRLLGRAIDEGRGKAGLDPCTLLDALFGACAAVDQADALIDRAADSAKVMVSDGNQN